MAKPYNINNAVATVTNVAMQAFHDQNNIIKDEITKAKEGPYIQVKLEVDVGAIRKPIIHIETQSPNPFDGKESIFVSLSSTRLPKGDMISTFITASDEEDLKYKVKDFVKDSWYYIKDGLNGMLGSTRYILEDINNLNLKEKDYMRKKGYMTEAKHAEAYGELFRAFNTRHEGIANFNMNIGPVEEARISWETKSDGSMKANLHYYYMKNDSTEHVTHYFTGDDAQELADNIIEYITVDYGNFTESKMTYNRQLKGNKMKKRYMKENANDTALVSVAKVVMDKVLNYGYSGKVDVYDAMSVGEQSPLKTFVGDNAEYDDLYYKVGTRTNEFGGTIITLSLDEYSWDTFIHLDEGASEYNIGTVADAIENLFPHEAFHESRRASRRGSYYRESTGYTINNIQSPLVKAILKNNKVTKEFNVSLPLNGVPGVDTVVAKGKIGGKINITANKGSKVVYAPYKGKLTAKNEEDIDESVFAFVRHIKDNVLNDFDRSGPDVKDNTKNFGKTYKFESRGGSLASYKYFKESLSEMVRGGRRFNEGKEYDSIEDQIEDALYSGKNSSFDIQTNMTPIAAVDMYVETLSGGDMKVVIYNYEIHTPASVYVKEVGHTIRGSKYNMQALIKNITNYIKSDNKRMEKEKDY